MSGCGDRGIAATSPVETGGPARAPLAAARSPVATGWLPAGSPQA
ncbi:hypothetical protein [Streptosporangium sp. OZ121]